MARSDAEGVLAGFDPLLDKDADVETEGENHFDRVHGRAVRELERSSEAATSQLTQLGAEVAELKRQISVEPPRIHKASNAPAPPPSAATIWRIIGWSSLLVGLSAWTWVNTARFTLEITQSWFAGLLLTAPLLLLPLLVKLALDRVCCSPGAKSVATFLLAVVGLAGFAAWVVLVLKNALPPSESDLNRGELGTATLAWQIIVQIITESTLGTLAYLQLAELINDVEYVDNPERLRLEAKLAPKLDEARTLEEARHEAAVLLGAAEGAKARFAKFCVRQFSDDAAFERRKAEVRQKLEADRSSALAAKAALATAKEAAVLAEANKNNTLLALRAEAQDAALKQLEAERAAHLEQRDRRLDALADNSAV